MEEVGAREAPVRSQGRSLRDYRATHLRKPEAGRLKFGYYNVIAKGCRDTLRKIGGGVLILAHASRNAEKLYPPLPACPPLRGCTIKFPPTENPETALLVSGFYLTPKKAGRVNLDLLRSVCRTVRNQGTDDQISQVLAGDFNVPLWSETYRVWRSGMG